MGHGPRGAGAYQQLHGLVLGALAVVVVVDIVGNGLARHVRVRGRTALRAVGLLRVAEGAGRQGSGGGRVMLITVDPEDFFFFSESQETMAGKDPSSTRANKPVRTSNIERPTSKVELKSW